ncbi:hypothetical protein [Haloterrigena salinisoli]|uniref:hypothetical protein n=1 Tax=Haloterrigena salinisoli TaxID=3132747 RepID=UPI0030CCFF49
MAESEQQEKMLSETIVKEAVGLGMKSPLRDSIVEAVDEAEGRPSGGGSGLPLAGILFGTGAALGFLAGRQSPELEETSLEDIQEPEIIEDVMEGGTGDDEETITEMTSETESEGETEPEGGSSRLLQLLVAVGAIAAAVVLRRRRSGDEEEEWEPIEEFEPATSDDMSESEDKADEETVEAEAETEDADEEEEE